MVLGFSERSQKRASLCLLQGMIEGVVFWNELTKKPAGN
jgi:hypothetical protein